MLRLIDSAEFDSSAKASRSPNDGYRALATFREFEKVTLGKVARSGADKQTLRSRRMYEKIVEEQAQRDKQGARLPSNWRYWLSILWRCAAVAGGLVLLYFLASFAITAVKTIF